VLDAVAAVRRAKRVLVATHVSPDVDAIGSLLGFGCLLERMGVSRLLLSQDGVPYEARFLPGVGAIVKELDGEFDLAVILDCPKATRIGEAAGVIDGLSILNIDHHETNAFFGRYNIVDATMASTSQLVFRFAAALGISVSGGLATCLLAGLIGDTQGFRTPGTDERVLHDAAALMAAGADLWQANHGVFGSIPRNHLLLWGRVLSGAVSEDGLVWGTIPLSVWRESGASEDDDTGIVNFLLGTDGTQAAALFSEDGKGKVRVSLRSIPGVDVASVAAAFGGGGHRQAAGCTVAGSLEEVTRKVLERLKGAVDESTVRGAAG